MEKVISSEEIVDKIGKMKEILNALNEEIIFENHSVKFYLEIVQNWIDSLNCNDIDSETTVSSSYAANLHKDQEIDFENENSPYNVAISSLSQSKIAAQLCSTSVEPNKIIFKNSENIHIENIIIVNDSLNLKKERKSKEKSSAHSDLRIVPRVCWLAQPPEAPYELLQLPVPLVIISRNDKIPSM